MNAPAPAQAVAPAKFEIALLTHCAPSQTRTQVRRRARFTKEEIAELAASIKSLGVLEPILVRPHPARPVDKVFGLEVKYEIVAGERRWLAAAQAGLAGIPVLVRDVADADLVQLQLVENLQRKTIDQLEEAEGYAELRQLKKLSPEGVAELLGISRSTVFNRLKLLDLCPEARQALEQHKLPASSAMLIARLGHHDTQRQVLKEAIGGGFDRMRNAKGHELDMDAPLSYRALSNLIEHDYMVDLKGAPFKLDDAALLPKAGDCLKCPKRAGNQKDLFVDIKNPNVCTDPKCFDDKRQAVYRKAADELRAKGRKVISGKDAKKVIPRWDDDYGDDRVEGGFAAMGQKIYSSNKVYGQTPAQILGKDYEPILVQHPLTGKTIEVASAQAIAAAIKGDKPKGGDDEDLPARARPKKLAPKVDLPDLDDQVTARLIQQIAEKAPKKFNRALLVSVAKMVLPEISARDDKLRMIAKQYGWPTNAFGGGYGHSGSFPKAAAGFDEAKIMLLFLYTVFASGWGAHGDEDVLEFLDIDADKTRETIIAERRNAQANARMKAKLAKASPMVKTGKKLKWPFPLKGGKKAAKGKKK
jgi:ParB/RepB/Spo0J family partition protein